ncbi:hypothetical protein KKI19_03480 [Patescibacteria group bacterium]|nr:hypothetical protein [Patescibacteria group bacterium]
MSKIDLKKRKMRIRIRKRRKIKLAKLRQEYSVAKSNEKKEKILEKVRKIAPSLSQEEFLAPTSS